MTDTVLKQIVQRAVRDGSFRAQLQSDPTKALAGYGITADERSAITSGDPARLTALGVDQRMSKAFTTGGLMDASKVVAPTDATKGVADFIDEGTTSGNAVIVGDPASGFAAPATLVQDVQSLSDLHMKLNEQDLNTGAAAVEAEAGGTVRSPMWRIEQDLDVGASGTAAPIDGSPEQAAFEAAPAAEAGPSGHLWQVEQDLDAGSSLETPSGDVQITGDSTISEN